MPKSRPRSQFVSRVSISMAACRNTAVVLAAVSVAACTTHPPTTGVTPADFLHDNAFPESGVHVVETHDAVFRLDDSAREFLDAKMAAMNDDARADARTLLQDLVHLSLIHI